MIDTYKYYSSDQQQKLKKNHEKSLSDMTTLIVICLASYMF